MYLTNKQKELLVKAILKGVAHATVAPLIILTLVNLLMSGNFGGIAAVLYIAVVAVLYNVVLEGKDFSKQAFNYTVGIVYGAMLFIITIGIILSAF